MKVQSRIEKEGVKNCLGAKHSQKLRANHWAKFLKIQDFRASPIRYMLHSRYITKHVIKQYNKNREIKGIEKSQNKSEMQQKRHHKS